MTTHVQEPPAAASPPREPRRLARSRRSGPRAAARRRTPQEGAAPEGAAAPSGSRPPRTWPALLFLVPSLIIFGLFVFLPMARSLVLSFQGSDLLGRPSGFVGFKHYARLFTDPDFAQVMLNTVLFATLTLVPTLLIALTLALLLMTTKLKLVGLFRTAYALPFAFSVATAAVSFKVMYNPVSGILNGLLQTLGLGRVDWLTSSSFLAMVSLAAATVWMNLGYNMLVLCAGTGSIDTSVLEAARIDGASGIRLARSIIIPLISPSLFFLAVTGTLSALQSFGQIHVLTNGGPNGGTTTLVYSIYKQAFADNNANFGYASAQSVVLSLLVLLVALIEFGVMRKKVHYQ